MTMIISIPNLASWRAWLKGNHSRVREVWLIFPKGTKDGGISYGDALDEALCWGWIDSLIKSRDESSYLRKFTPRTNLRNWSAVNVRRLRELLKAKRVRPSGLAAIAPEVMERIRGRASEPAPRQPLPYGMTPEFQTALDGNGRAQAFFSTLAPSYRRNYLHWVSTAKRAETRARRAREAARLLAKGVKVLLK
jgi:uncharacterized protein YdeI (YjbR/CyaY-like superfamily)